MTSRAPRDQAPPVQASSDPAPPDAAAADAAADAAAFASLFRALYLTSPTTGGTGRAAA
jgi:hypothetical protein